MPVETTVGGGRGGGMVTPGRKKGGGGGGGGRNEAPRLTVDTAVGSSALDLLEGEVAISSSSSSSSTGKLSGGGSERREALQKRLDEAERRLAGIESAKAERRKLREL